MTACCAAWLSATISNLDDFTEARTWLERAIALDPGYAAHLRPARGLAQHPGRPGLVDGSEADYAEVIRLATAAFERDSFDAMALALCGHVKSLLLHKFDDAIALFDRAIAASPSSAIAWTRSSPTYSYIGDAQEAHPPSGARVCGCRRSTSTSSSPTPSWASRLYVAADHEEGMRWGRQGQRGEPRGGRRTCASSPSTWPRLASSTRPAKWGARSWRWSPGFQVDRFLVGYAAPRCRAGAPASPESPTPGRAFRAEARRR